MDLVEPENGLDFNIIILFPIVIAMAKGLTCGYLPFGCLMVSDKIATKFDDTVLALGLTYSAHPVSCAAALETLKFMKNDHLIENAAAMGKYMDAQVELLKQKHPSIGDWRNTGLLGCLEIVKIEKQKNRWLLSTPNQMKWK